MQLQTIVYVTDMAASTAWYQHLLDRSPTVASDHWTSFTCDGATLALHSHDQKLSAGNVELSLVVSGTLEDARARTDDPTEIIEQPFGRSFTVTDPDGARIQINEHA